MNHFTPERVAIVGAGIGGLTTAIALRSIGMHVDVYEQSPQLGEVGAGITVTPNADAVLRHLGLRDAISEGACVPARQLTQAVDTGNVILEKELKEFSGGGDGTDYYHVHRADLHTALADAFTDLAPDGLHLGYALTHCTADGTAHFENGEQITADLLIGCDGVKSVVRDSVFQTGAPRFTGQVAWRGLVPTSRLPEGARVREPGIHIGPDLMLARYPVRSGTLMNFVAFVALDDWTIESWSTRSSAAELAQHFSPCEPELLALIESAAEDQVYKWALHVREPLEHWSHRRVTLLGDAAHAMLPFLGQGAAMAMEDAIVLQRCLANFDLETALKVYGAMRQPRAALVQHQSRLRGEAFQGSNPEDFADNPIKSAEEMGLYAYDAAAVPLAMPA